MTIETKIKIGFEANKYLNARATLQKLVAQGKLDLEDEQKAYALLLGRQRALENLERKLEPVRFDF